MGDGTVFSVVTGPWMISTAAAPADAGGWTNELARQNLAFAEFPAGPGGQHTFIGGSNLGIFNECPHPEAAVELVKYLVSPESQVRFGSAIGFLPALLKAQEDPAFDNPMHNVFKAAAATGKVPPAIVEWGGVENIMKTELEKIWEEVAAKPGQVLDAGVVKSHLDAGAASVNDILGQ
jgi:multiple sugar transport system substrate-binding protein